MQRIFLVLALSLLTECKSSVSKPNPDQEMDALLLELENDHQPILDLQGAVDVETFKEGPCILCALDQYNDPRFKDLKLPYDPIEPSPSQLSYAVFLRHIAQNALRVVKIPDAPVYEKPYLTAKVARRLRLGDSIIIHAIDGPFAKIGDKEYIELSHLQELPNELLTP